MSRKEFLASTLERTGLGSVLSGTLCRWRGLLVFNYHRIGDPANSNLDRGVFSATQEEFDLQVRFLKKHFDIVRVSDLDDLQKSRGRAILLTFDDGYRDNYSQAFEVLKSHQVPAVFFVASGFIDHSPLAWWDELAWMVRSSTKHKISLPGQFEEQLFLSTPEEREDAILRLLQVYKSLPSELTDGFENEVAMETGTGRAPADLATGLWMTWDMIREVDRAGIDIGGHTVTHPVLAQCSVEVQRAEIFRSKARIEEMLGHPITAFSYPVGQPESFTEATQNLLQEAGYRWSFTFRSGFSVPEPSNRLVLPRVAVAPNVSRNLFQATAQFPWLFT
ncbi:polysaccharide deacetylase family protein [Planctomicrobium sp. SH527]|uniref:polysaccharide deacetylase family protein n=1 Tax=Planctomicrobium sp. SH527 TaxID=3448123 RepID=UPI003F5BA55E